MEDFGGNGGNSQDMLPVLSVNSYVKNCDCGAVVQVQTTLLRQRLMNSVAYELSEYEQFMSSFLSDQQVVTDCDSSPNEIDCMLAELLRMSVNILISVIKK